MLSYPQFCTAAATVALMRVISDPVFPPNAMQAPALLPWEGKALLGLGREVALQNLPPASPCLTTYRPGFLDISPPFYLSMPALRDSEKGTQEREPYLRC